MSFRPVKEELAKGFRARKASSGFHVRNRREKRKLALILD